MSEFTDRFQPDPELDGVRRTWITRKPLLQDSVVSYAPPYPDYPKRSTRHTTCDPSCSSARDVGDEVVVSSYSNNGNGFCMYQERAWSFIADEALAVEASLRRKLYALHQKSLKQFIEEILPDFRRMKNYWNAIEDKLDWHDSSAVDHLYKLVGVGLVDNGLDECGFSSFEFQTGWDQDHGVGILMHKDRVLAAGGMQEDISRGPELIESIKYVQSYDFDEGDLSLIDR